jgi:exopolysaccharide biosynthesis predicted pyruvyltransferase EpsI
VSPGGVDMDARLRTTLDAEIPRGSRVVLLDYPNHENVGDSAIWLGEVAYLRSRGCRVLYHCDLRSYDPRQLRELGEVDIFLLHGGGNLGDLWEAHQLFRQRVLEDFADRRVVQLPQTIHFDREENIAATRRAFAAHPDFTLLVRDQRSLEFAEERFDCRSILCPDSAVALGRLRRSAARSPILWLGRTDHEAAVDAAGSLAGAGDVEVADWVGRRNAPTADVIGRAGGELIAAAVGSSRAARSLRGPLWRTWKRLADHRLEAGVEVLSRGEVVITDRLHGHILCLLLAIPHVLLDNSYGKLSSYAETWGTLGPEAIWSDSVEGALGAARQLGEATASRPGQGA